MSALLALALGIGANTAIFSVINAVLLRPLPFPDSDRLVLFSNTRKQPEIDDTSPARFNFWRKQISIVQDVSAYRYGSINFTGVQQPEQIKFAEVSHSYFPLFGLSLLRGRSFTTNEDRPGGGNVAIVSESFWRRVLSSDPKVLGKSIKLGGRSYEVIGIMSRPFETQAPLASGPASFNQVVDVWKPFQIDPASNDENGFLTVAARLRPGVSLTAANAALEVATRNFRRQFPRMSSTSTFTVWPIKTIIRSHVHNQLSILSVAVGFVLLIACLNVASLSLARATDRKREIGIRAAIGANRNRLVRQMLTESVILSTAGGVLGVALGLAGIRLLLTANSFNIPRVGQYGSQITADWRVLLFSLVVSIGSGILFGLLPALDGSSGAVSKILKESTRLSGGGLRANKARSLLVITEIAIALILLIGTTHMIRGFIAVRFSNPGFDPKNVLSMRISLTGSRFQSTEEASGVAENALSRLNVLPGVLAAASTCCVPLDSDNDHLISEAVIANRPSSDTSHAMVNVTTVSPGYFRVLKIPLLDGRLFTPKDNRASEPVVIVSQAFLHRFWRRTRITDDRFQTQLLFPDAPGHRWRIVGVVGDLHAEGLSNEAPPIVYFAMAQSPEELTQYVVNSNPIGWIVRVREDSRAMRAALQTQLSQASGGLPVTNVRSMDEILARSVAGRRFNMLLLIVFGSSAVLLAAIGVFALITYSVHRRTNEIGIRIALGAELWNVRGMVMLQGLRLTVFGVAIGIVGSWILTHSIDNFLFSLKVEDSLALTIAPVLIAGIALFATWIPTRSVSKLDPAQALRHE